MSNVGEFLKQIKVHDCNLTKIRIGNDHDGGYIAYDELCRKAPVVYSFGVGNDVGFELDWVRRYPDTKVKLFDPTIPRLPETHKRFSFYKYGIGLGCKPLKKVEQDALLKMDVEWDEWGAFRSFDMDELKKFSQLLVEFHIIHVQTPRGLTPYFTKVYGDVMSRVNEDLFHLYYEILKWLDNWFAIFHIHANNSLPLVSINGWKFPPLIELSLIRRDLAVELRPTKSKFPIEGLDLPNKTDRPDIYNYYPMVENGTKRKVKANQA